jgi:sec-independent protein translocase protein TatA
MLNGLSGWHWIVILLIILLLFGAPKLPALARSVGQSMRIFRAEVKNKDEAPADSETSTERGETKL